MATCRAGPQKTSDIEIVTPPFAVSPNGQFHMVQGCPSQVYESGGSQKEFDFSKAAGDSAVTPRARFFLGVHNGEEAHLMGFVMDPATPIVPGGIPPEQRRGLAQSMVRVVRNLHKKGVVHGDLKLQNMLVDGNREVRLCDFDEARYIDENEDAWEGVITLFYLSPNRWRKEAEMDRWPAPTREDDLYGLALSMCELYTGKMPHGEDAQDDETVGETLLEEGTGVDLMEVEDEDVRDMIRGLLRQGGALV